MRQVTLEELRHYLQTFSTRDVDRAFLHHTWSPTTAQYRGSYTWKGITNYHVHTRGWSDNGYHLGVGPDDSMWLLRPIGEDGAHVKYHNDDTIGVVLLGNFDVEDPWAHGLATACAVLAECCRCHNLTEDQVFFHRDHSDKTCPGTRIHHKEVRRLVAKILRGQAAEVMDPGLPSLWAAEAWDWAVGEGLVDGTSPRGPVTREMLVTVLHRNR